MSNRITKLRKILKEKKLDGFVVFTVEDNNKNVRYLSGFGGSFGVLVLGGKKQVLLVDPRYTERAQKEAKGFTVIEVANAKGLYEYIERGLELIHLGRNARLGYEGRNVSVIGEKSLSKNLPQKLVPTEGVVEGLRQYKSEEEVAFIRHACRATSEAFCEVVPNIKAGMKESEISMLIDIALRKYGATQNSFSTIAASGPNAAIPHHETSDRRVRAGETLVLDFGGIFKGGYASDLSRTLFIPGKKPDPEFVRIYNAVRGAQESAQKTLYNNPTFKEYDSAARSYLEKAGYGKYFTHSIGHSLGLEAHDPFDYRGGIIKVGTVLTNEPGVYIPGRGGVRIEDDLVITKSGPKRLTTAPYLKF
ncbi:MAG: Xaa-Pro peptidase family protein [bacterium]|nr:Xaa-Pro peptidase family protein [bacterium]